MPIDSELSGGAAGAAESEAMLWMELASVWRAEAHPEVWNDLPGSEANVVGWFDPTADRARRMQRWSYEPGRGDLSDLCRFAAGLAQAEADAWRADVGHVATRAATDRRFLLGDRILHWAVPWLDAVSRCYPAERARGEMARDRLLMIAEQLRPVPLLTGTEGTVPPGEDRYGPRDTDLPLDQHMASVWCGVVILRPTLASMLGRPVEDRLVRVEWLSDPAFRRDLATLFDLTARRWSRMSGEWPGSAGLWDDLCRRALQTTARLGGAG